MCPIVNLSHPQNVTSYRKWEWTFGLTPKWNLLAGQGKFWFLFFFFNCGKIIQNLKFYSLDHFWEYGSVAVSTFTTVTWPTPAPISRTFSSSQLKPYPVSNDFHPLSRSPWKWPPASNYVLPLWFSQPWTPRMNGTVQRTSFCDWLVSLSIASLRSAPAVAHVRISFLLKAEWYSAVCIDRILFSPSSSFDSVFFFK